MYHFGEYRYDSRAGLTTPANGVVPLPPKESALLELLLSHQGRTVRHDEIIRELWPNQSVGYSSVTRCVYSLRKILGGSKRAYVQSVARQGYRLAVAVRRDGLREKTMAEKISSAQPRAYAEFLEGLREVNDGKERSLGRAIQLFRRCLRSDPEFAVAWSSIADVVIYRMLRGYVRPLAELQPGLEACDEALAIDKNLASAHAARGWLVAIVGGDYQTGLASLNTALELDESYARGYVYRGWVHRAAGRLGESLADARAAESLDPHSLMIRHALAWSLFCAGHSAEAESVLRRLISEYPGDEVIHAYFALMTAWTGPGNSSVEAARKAVALSNGNPAIATALAYALARRGDAWEARRLADSLLTDSLPRAPLPHVATVHVALGDFDRAVTLFARAREERCPWFTAGRFDPRVDMLAEDKRFVSLYENAAND